MTQNSIPNKNTYQKQDKILSQTDNNHNIASPPTDQCNKCFLKGLNSEGMKWKSGSTGGMNSTQNDKYAICIKR